MFALFEKFTNWMWGLPLLITILVTGIYLTVRSGFFQFRHFGYIVKNLSLIHISEPTRPY